jgi:hypothetical protein
MWWGSGSFSGGSWISSSFRRGAVRSSHRATQLSIIVDVSCSFLLTLLQEAPSSSGFVSKLETWLGRFVVVSSADAIERVCIPWETNCAK